MGIIEYIVITSNNIGVDYRHKNELDIITREDLSVLGYAKAESKKKAIEIVLKEVLKQTPNIDIDSLDPTALELSNTEL